MLSIGDGRQRNQGLFGQTLVNQNNDLDERTLTAIADLTGGIISGERSGRTSKHISSINKLEPIDRYKHCGLLSFFHWPLAVSNL